MEKQDRIAIIGAGISGLLAAYELEAKGYRKVTVFEKNERPGGKLHSIFYQGKSHELGAIFGLPSQKKLKALMKELDIKGDGPSLSRMNYSVSGERIPEISGSELESFLREMEELPRILAQYDSLNSPSMEGLEEELMIPFSQWCDSYNFRVLKTIYTHYFTIFGLGDIEEMPAVYVFKILNYDDFMSFMQIPRFTTWKDGVSVITDRLAEELGDLRLGQEIIDINILEGEEGLALKTRYEVLNYDKLIITAPLDNFIKMEIWDDESKNHLKRIQYQDFNVYGFIVDKLPKGCGCLLENLARDRWGHILIWDSRWNRSGEEGLLMVYAYSPEEGKEGQALDLIKKDLEKLGIASYRLYQVKSWKHCPHVDSRSLKDGFYDHLESIQGRNNIYLAGEIMSSLSMENCIGYSSELVKRRF